MALESKKIFNSNTDDKETKINMIGCLSFFVLLHKSLWQQRVSVLLPVVGSVIELGVQVAAQSLVDVVIPAVVTF